MSLNKAYIGSTQVASSVPFDNTTGDGFIGSNVQSALQELRNYTIYDSNTTATTTNGTLILSSPTDGGDIALSKSLQFLTGSATGYSVQLPDAMALSLSAYYQIINQGSHPVVINDGSGALLFNLGQNSIGYAYLQLNGTIAGIWIYHQISTNNVGILPNYSITSSVPFTTSASSDTLITGMTTTPQAGTYAIWYSASSAASGGGSTLTTSIYAGATIISESAREDTSPAGSHIFSNQTLATFSFDGITGCSIYVNSHGNSITVNQRTLLLIRLGT